MDAIKLIKSKIDAIIDLCKSVDKETLNCIEYEYRFFCGRYFIAHDKMKEWTPFLSYEMSHFYIDPKTRSVKEMFCGYHFDKDQTIYAGGNRINCDSKLSIDLDEVIFDYRNSEFLKKTNYSTINSFLDICLEKVNQGFLSILKGMELTNEVNNTIIKMSNVGFKQKKVGLNMSFENMKQRMLDNMFIEVEAKMDASGRIGIQSEKGLALLSKNEKDEYLIELNIMSELTSFDVPAFATKQDIKNISAGDVLCLSKNKMAFVIDVKENSVVVLKPDGHKTTYTPQKATFDGVIGFHVVKSMFSMSGGDSSNQMQMMMMMKFLSDGSDDNKSNEMMKMMMMSQMMNQGGNQNNQGFNPMMMALFMK